jgi:hypothetical protein
MAALRGNIGLSSLWQGITLDVKPEDLWLALTSHDFDQDKWECQNCHHSFLFNANTDYPLIMPPRVPAFVLLRSLHHRSLHYQR